jgi:hypothetical protein
MVFLVLLRHWLIVIIHGWLLCTAMETIKSITRPLSVAGSVLTCWDRLTFVALAYSVLAAVCGCVCVYIYINLCFVRK